MLDKDRQTTTAMDPFFREFGYKVLRQVYDPKNHRAGLADLFAYTRQLPTAASDTQSPNSPAYYRNTEISKLMMRLMPSVAQATGLALYPTYAYLRLYGAGARLERHRDREACEISCTFCIGYEDDYSWPIWLRDLKGTEHEITQEPGDLVIYRGIEVEHWRVPADDRIRCQAQAFLHYVDQDGPHQDEIFDTPGMNALFQSLSEKAEAQP